MVNDTFFFPLAAPQGLLLQSLEGTQNTGYLNINYRKLTNLHRFFKIRQS
jgi:hypothetical protein